MCCMYVGNGYNISMLSCWLSNYFIHSLIEYVLNALCMPGSLFQTSGDEDLVSAFHSLVMNIRAGLLSIQSLLSLWIQMFLPR